MKLVILVVVAETESNKCRCIFQYHSTSAHTYSFIHSFFHLQPTLYNFSNK